MMRILICSSHHMQIAGFRSILKDRTEAFEITVVPDPCGLAHRIKAAGSQLVIADMTSGFSLELLETLHTTCPEVGVILWIGSVPTEFISQALRFGVLGILPKNASAEAHLECIRQVSEGELWVEADLSKQLVLSRSVHLTPRERQLTVLLAQGLKNKEMGYRLGITEGTIKVYLSHLYAKVGVGDRLDLALLALKNLGGEHAPNSTHPVEVSSSTGSSFMPAVICIGQTPVHVH